MGILPLVDGAVGDAMLKALRRVLTRSLILPLLGLVLLTLLLVSPSGDFPLNDDWVYATAVCELVHEHHWVRHPFANALALSHTLWGGLFASLLGFSFGALRLSTLTLALIAAWATARCGEELALPRRISLLCGALLLANPIFLNLAYTFMSEASFVAPWTLAGWFYLRGVGNGRPKDLAWGSGFAALAFLTRQFGVLITAAALLVLLVEALRGRQKIGAAQLIALAAPWLIVLPITIPFIGSGDGLEWPSWIARPGFIQGLLLVPGNAAVCLLYLGLFTLPLACGGLLRRWRSGERFGREQWMMALAVAAFVCVGEALFEGTGPKPLPILGNVLYDLGTGPFTLRDVFFSNGKQPPPVQVGWLWWPVTLAALGSISFLCAEILPGLARRIMNSVDSDDCPASAQRSQAAQQLFLMCWLLGVLVVPYQYLGPSLFDRYLVPALPPALLLAGSTLVGSEWRAGAMRVAWLCCALMYLVSLACVQDYMAWNRARWAGIDYLMEERGVPASAIDAGFEYNGRYTLDEFQRRTGARSFWKQGRYGFWVVGNDYAISSSPRSGRRELKRLPYFSWLGMRERSLLVLERANTPQGVPLAEPAAAGGGRRREPFCGPGDKRTPRTDPVFP